MKSLRHSIAVLVALMLLVAVPAAAEVFHVQLKNGNSIETRYRPKVADWDESKVVVVTEVGNRITVQLDDIVDVTSDTEVKGYGTVIDTTTIVIGWAPNDTPSGDQPVDPTAQWMNYLQETSQRQNFSVQQFVNSEDAGGGLPAWDFGPGPAAYGGQTVVVAPPPPTGPPPQ